MIRRVAPATFVLVAFACCRPESSTDTMRFPDLANYTPVDVAGFQVDASTPGHRATQVVFLTPDGITCAFSVPAAAGCTGNNFPGVPPAAAGVNSIATNSALDTTNAPIARTPALKTLPPLHTLTVNGVTCGVDDKRTTACKDSQGRGFVMSTKGTTWLPHV